MLEIILAFSTHFLPGEWNEIHPGIRYEQNHFVGALFLNSEDNPSVAVGLIGRRGNLFGEIGLATGYSAAPVVPFARVGLEFDRARFFVAPAATVDGDIGLVVGVEIIGAKF